MVINCFKIHGYPDWYKELKNHMAPNRVRANFANADMDSPQEASTMSGNEDSLHNSAQNSLDLSAVIQKEIAKYMKDKTHITQAHFAQVTCPHQLLVIIYF